MCARMFVYTSASVCVSERDCGICVCVHACVHVFVCVLTCAFLATPPWPSAHAVLHFVSFTATAPCFGVDAVAAGHCRQTDDRYVMCWQLCVSVALVNAVLHFISFTAFCLGANAVAAGHCKCC